MENKFEDELKKSIIETLIKIAKTGHKEKGSIVVLGGNPIYKSLKRENNIKSFNILDDLSLFESLCKIDGAVILDENGVLKDYAVMIESDRVYVGYGTRNSASLSASLQKDVNYVFLASATEKKVKIFKSGQIIMQIDALEKNIEKKVHEINEILSSLGVGTLGFLGATSMGMVGITLTGGVIIFGSFYYLLKKLGDEQNKIRDFFKRWERK